jgi:hypothetical protein
LLGRGDAPGGARAERGAARGGGLSERRPASFIGRLASSSLRIQDPRVSEAHALVTLRGRELMLLALRGGVQVNGVAEDAAVLEAGQTLSFAPGVEVTVVEVALPTQVLVLLADGADPLEPCAAVHALLPGRHWVPTWRPEALVHVWPTDAAWMIQVHGRAERLVAGRSWEVGGITLRAAWVPLEQLASERTALATSTEPVEVVGRSDTAEIRRPGREPVTLGGVPARLLTEFGLLGRPTAWDTVATELWPDAPEHRRRHSFDRALQRLRRDLREHGLREDLVRAAGRGCYELHVGAGGRFVDEA